MFLHYVLSEVPQEPDSLGLVLPAGGSKVPDSALRQSMSLVFMSCVIKERCSWMKCPEVRPAALCHSPSRWLGNQRAGFSKTSAQLFLVRNFGVSQSWFQHQATKNTHFHHHYPERANLPLTVYVGFLIRPKEWTRWQLWNAGDSTTGIWFWCRGKRKWDIS